MLQRRPLALALALAAGSAVALGPHGAPAPASAAVSVHATLDDLVASSGLAIVGVAGERTSQWEELPSGKRITTYTKVVVEQRVFGEGAAPKEVWVRTLGGAVGRVGQVVSGEAQLATGERALLFLSKVGERWAVTAMAQGHYPIVKDAKGEPRLRPSPDAGLLVHRPGPVLTAYDELVGYKMDDAVARVKARRAARASQK